MAEVVKLHKGKILLAVAVSVAGVLAVTALGIYGDRLKIVRDGLGEGQVNAWPVVLAMVLIYVIVCVCNHPKKSP